MDLEGSRLISDMDSFLSSRNGGRYADICAFHETDLDLALNLHETETDFFRDLRRMGQRPTESE